MTVEEEKPLDGALVLPMGIRFLYSSGLLLFIIIISKNNFPI